MRQTWTRVSAHTTTLTASLTAELAAALLRALAMAHPGGLEPFDERGGARNSDEGFHIAGGAVVAGAIVAAVGAFVADRLGLLQ